MQSDNVKLNSHQKTVLAIVASSPTPKVAASDISRSANLNQSAQILARLGVIIYDQASASLTPAGVELSQEENITDSSGQLTTNGTVYLKMNAVSLQGISDQGSVAESILLQLLHITHGNKRSS